MFQNNVFNMTSQIIKANTFAVENWLYIQNQWVSSYLNELEKVSENSKKSLEENVKAHLTAAKVYDEQIKKAVK